MAKIALCSVSGCDKPGKASGICYMHRARRARGGTLDRRHPKLSLHDLLKGQVRFGDWTVLGEAMGVARPGNGVIRHAHVRCDCGNERSITVNSLKRGTSRHCGCKVSAIITELKSTHRSCKTSEYRAWQKAKERCTNPKRPEWPHYGGRGIRMAAEWIDDPAAFLAYMGPKPSPKHSLDRINVNGHYEPGNVRWADAKTQGRNKRTNRIVQFHGRDMTLSEACEIAGVSIGKAHDRLKRGYSLDAALTP